MSRSRKKVPIGGVCHAKSGIMKWWKTNCNKKVRKINIEEEIGNKAYVRKMVNPWSSPKDGKTYYHHKEAYRK